MRQYKQMVEHVLANGETRVNRTGINTSGCFGYQTRFKLFEGFPLVTMKRTNFNAVKAELLWFLRGQTNTNELNATIWDEWADEHGDLGPIYGEQWRSWPGVTGAGKKCRMDQMRRVIGDIRQAPYSRRHIVSAWNASQVDDMALAPCHVMLQFYVTNAGRLSCHLYQRSADLFLGVPFNIASYALLTHIVAHFTDLKVGELVHTFGDLHLYQNHLDQVSELLSREPLDLPRLEFDDPLTTLPPSGDYLAAIDSDAINLMDYVSHPPIKAKVAV